MLSGLFGLAAQEGEEEDSQAGTRTEQDASEEQSSSTQEHTEGASSSAGTAGLSFWSIANVLSTTVKARADELVKSVAQTDWKSELMAFSKEAAEEGKQISHKAVEVVEHLPDVVENLHLPEKAEKVAAQLTTNHPEVSTTINHVGASIKTFGTTLFSGTKELIEQVRDAVESEIAVAAKETRQKARASSRSAAATVASKLPAAAKYNRFEAEVASMQRDSSTYCDEPPETEEYTQWRAAFSLTEAQPRIEALLADNSFMAELQSRIVPVIVEYDDFWHRYFFRLHKLQVKAEMQQKITQLATKAHQEEEELGGWDDLDTPTSKAAETAATSLDAAIPDVAASAVRAEAGAAVADDGGVAQGPSGLVEDEAEGQREGGKESKVDALADPALAAAATSKAEMVQGGDVHVPPEPSEHETGSDASRGDWCVLGSRGSGSAITARTSEQQDAGSVHTDAGHAGAGQGQEGGDAGGSRDASKVSSPRRSDEHDAVLQQEELKAPGLDAAPTTSDAVTPPAAATPAPGSGAGQQQQGTAGGVSGEGDGSSDVDVDGFLDELDLEPEAGPGDAGRPAGDKGKKKSGEDEEDEAWGDWD